MKKLLLSCAVLLGLSAFAQEAPIYTATAYAYSAGYSGYGDFIPELPIPVEAFEDHIVLRNWSGIEGRDLSVGFGEDDAMTYLAAYNNGEGKGMWTTEGYTDWIYTGIPKSESNLYAVKAYMGGLYSNATSDPETKSGYVIVMLYTAATDDEPNEYLYYYVAWGEEEEHEIIGSEDNTTPWWSAWSGQNLGFEGDGSMHYEFYNYSNCENNWDNWVMVLTNAPYTPNDGDNYGIEQELIVFRSDAWGWGPLWETSTVEHNYDWETFKEEMNQAWVEIDITREGQTVEVHAVTTTVDEKEYTYNIRIPGVSEPYLGSFLTVEGGHLEIYDAYLVENAGFSAVANDTNAPAVYYNLQGMAVNPETMTTGIYIMRQGNSAQKVLIRK